MKQKEGKIMMNTQSQTPMYDVLITGAGPVGMTLASELQRRGIRFRIIDKSLYSAQTTKALGMQARTLELLEKSGIADKMLAQGRRVTNFTIHSNRQRLAQIDFAQFVDSPYPYILMIPQDKTEAVLNDHLLEQGITIERGIELINLTQSTDQVQITLRGVDGVEEQVSTRWLLACDGAHSTVRHLLDIKFEGEAFEESFVLADLSLDGSLDTDGGSVYLHDGNAMAFFPMLDGQYRVFIAYKPPTNPDKEITLEEIQHMVDLCGPANVRVHNPTWWSRFHINQRKVRNYRKDHVFLLGDAAHIHSPVAAQGMNTGMQDAYDLAWKLALVLSEQAPVSLLDSYNAEREPVGKALLRFTRLFSRIVWSHNPLFTTSRDRIIPIAAPVKAVQRRITNSISQTNINYRHSPLVTGQSGEHRHLRAGDRAPHAPIQTSQDSSPRQLFELLHDTRHVLLLFSDGQPASEACIKETQDTMCRKYQQIITAYRIDHSDSNDPNSTLRQRYDVRGAELMLIRPDGYIALRSATLAPDILENYLAQHYCAEAQHLSSSSVS